MKKKFQTILHQTKINSKKNKYTEKGTRVDALKIEYWNCKNDTVDFQSLTGLNSSTELSNICFM